MPKYVRYDPAAPEPSPVTGLYDADMAEYPDLPPAEELLEVSDEVWTTLPGPWAVQAGALITYAPPVPPPTLPQQAQAMVNAPVTVVCAAMPELNGDYPNNEAIRSQVNSVVTKLNAGRGLPGGGARFNWPDADGGPRLWPAAQFVDFADQLADFIYEAIQVAQGHSDTLPSKTLTI